MVGYTANIQEPYYTQIVSRRKTVEGRLDRDKWANMKQGDHIYISGADVSLSLPYRIVQVVHATSFVELHKIFETKLLPDIPASDHEAAANVYRKWFSDEDVYKYGVVGIVLQPLFKEGAQVSALEACACKK